MLDEAYRNRNMLAVRPEWLALNREAALDPALPIIDPHHHLWLMPQCPYPIEALAADTAAGHNIRATVYVEAHTAYRSTGPEALWPVGETEFVVAEIARLAAAQGPSGHCAGIVGAMDFTLGAGVEAVLAAHVVAAGGRFRGVRLRAAAHADPAFPAAIGAPPEGFLLQPEVQAACAQVGQAGLSLDVWVFHSQLQDVAALAAACPGTPMVLNHVGGVLGIGPYAGRRDEVFLEWRQHIRALARLDNLSVKLGGLCMPRVGFGFDAAATPPTSEMLAAAWRPYIETCIEAFGVARCMFESNFPVDKGMCGYVETWNAFTRIAAGASAAERSALFAGTAARFYRLDSLG